MIVVEQTDIQKNVAERRFLRIGGERRAGLCTTVTEGTSHTTADTLNCVSSPLLYHWLSASLENRGIGKKKNLNSKWSLSPSAKWAKWVVGSSSHYFLLFACRYFSFHFVVYFVSPFWETKLWLEEAKGKAKTAGSCRKPAAMATYTPSSAPSALWFPSKQDHEAFCMAHRFVEMKD